MNGAYAAAAVADPFARTASFLTSLISSLSSPEALLLSHERIEEDAETGARELARLLLQAHLDLRARTEETALRLIADRLDITGSRWSLAGAEAVLTLRAVISNNDFPEYWIFHTTRERERLYPQPDQHAYGLSA